MWIALFRKSLLILTILMATMVRVALHADAVSASIGTVGDTGTDVADGDYRSILAAWEASTYEDNAAFVAAISASTFTGIETPDDNQGLPEAAAWGSTDVVSFTVTVPSTGLYRFALSFFPLSDDYLDLEAAITVNGETPYAEAGQIILYKRWQADSGFGVDRYGNDFYGSQSQIDAWIEQSFFDPMGLYVEPLAFRLEAGANTITLTRVKGDFLLGDFTVTGTTEWPTYDAYLGAGQMAEDVTLITCETEIPAAKSSSSIQAGISRDLNVTPFSVRTMKLNVLSGYSWSSERETVWYDIQVETAGYYQLTFKVLQNVIANSAVFRTLYVNGVIPFAEAATLGIGYSPKWQNYTPAGTDSEPYLFWLEAGWNSLALAVNLAPYRETYYVVKSILKSVNQLSLDIKKLTGNQLDEERDWNITDNMPTIVADLTAMADALETERIRLDALNLSEKASEGEYGLKIAVRNLRFLAAKPNDIPKNITMLATSSTSIASTIGSIISMLLYSPLDIDKFYVSAGADIPAANAGFFSSVWLAIKRFFLSFFDERYVTAADPEELEVWVNRPKQYVDLIQKMVDESFTTATGIPVKVSVMAAEGKLILANSAGKNPDVALGVSSWLPYDLGLRGAILDLTTFSEDPDFATTLQLFHPQSLIPMIYSEGLYGLPDTENFYVLFYRTDILDTLGLNVPNTWNDVTEMMPVLKRYGMNFYITLSSATSLKSFDSTLPFLFQYGSSVYHEDAFTAAVDDPASIAALTMMTELYSIYAMDVTVSSFYNDFRLGVSPIGIGDFGMYITLLNAAPDIQGLWGIALLPGVDQGDGTIDRSAPGAQTANMVFANTEKKDESWAFLKWWASTATQSDFASLLIATLGKEYLWNSANQTAFQASGFAADDVAVILEQWSWLKELPKVPGSYQVELEISNLWNSVVLDRANLRVELNDAVIRMNKEIRKKMYEFGYMDAAGNVLKAYPLATEDLIRRWTEGGTDDE
ncbi:MAG: extracellular solute-binding protein [bacterium]